MLDQRQLNTYIFDNVKFSCQKRLFTLDKKKTYQEASAEKIEISTLIQARWKKKRHQFKTE